VWPFVTVVIRAAVFSSRRFYLNCDDTIRTDNSENVMVSSKLVFRFRGNRYQLLYFALIRMSHINDAVKFIYKYRRLKLIVYVFNKFDSFSTAYINKVGHERKN